MSSTPISRLPRAASRAWLLAAAVLLAAPGGPRAAEPAPSAEAGRLVLDEARLWDFAEALFTQGEYYRAVTEYRRLVYFFPQGPHAESARVRIGEAYLHGGEPAQAQRQFDQLLGAAPPARRDGLLYLRGLTWLERDAEMPYSLRAGQIDSALADFRALAPGTPEGARVAPFLAAMGHVDDAPHRSPGLAGTMSAVLPGAGSVYDGRYAEGALAFFVNALLIASTANAFQHHQPALGTTLGVFALAFYGGAIYAAVNGAHKFNDRAQAAYLDEQRTRFGIVLLPGGAGGAIRRGF